MKINTILDQIDLGSVALPEFQRGYVWNREQVRNLMASLYQKHPIGSLLVWVTQTENVDTRGDGYVYPGFVKLLLDGQQRITSLYGIIKGKPPKFFDGNKKAILDLYFNLEEEVFEFYGPLKMKENPFWINVTKLMQNGIGESYSNLKKFPDLEPKMDRFVNRLIDIQDIKERELHIEEVTGEDKTVDVVVDIFNRVNSGGTKLSKGDLALAKICAKWPEARDEMKERLNKWKSYGFYFKLEWFLRCINTIITGEALFSAMKNVNAESFKTGLNKAEKHVDYLINLISARIGLDHDTVLGSRYSFPLLVRYLDINGGRLTDPIERDSILYWYIHTFLWGRYAGSTESVLNQDLALIENKKGTLDRLINQLRQNRGDLRLNPNDFFGWSRGARFYPLLYMLIRIWKAKDWETGIELSEHLLGKFSQLHLHHIFPKALLYKHGYHKADVNALANFTFLTQETNLKVSDKNPSEYLEEYAQKDPDLLKSHWIPLDRNLWKVENFSNFLSARRELLADAANDFLESLVSGSVPEQKIKKDILKEETTVIPGSIESKEEEQLIKECNDWVISQGLPEGELRYELVDYKTGMPLANLDLAWPKGLQEGLSEPVALLIDEGRETEEAANQAGFRFFTKVENFKDYVESEILAIEEERA